MPGLLTHCLKLQKRAAGAAAPGTTGGTAVIGTTVVLTTPVYLYNSVSKLVEGQFFKICSGKLRSDPLPGEDDRNNTMLSDSRDEQIHENLFIT